MLITKNDNCFGYKKILLLKSRTYMTAVVHTLNTAFSQERHLA